MERVCTRLQGCVMTAEEAAGLIRSGMTIGCSGFARTGYPKAVSMALARSGHANNLTIISGASTGQALDGALCDAGLERRRYPYQNDKSLRAGINDGSVLYGDMHLSHLPAWVNRGLGPHIDVALVECAAVTEDGIVPPASVGAMDAFIRAADRLILEVNSTIPLNIYGMHSIWSPGVLPHTQAIPITDACDRIGSVTIPCPWEKVAAVVMTDDPGSFFTFKEPDAVSRTIAANIVEVLKKEVAQGRLPQKLPPIQSGTGSVANSVLFGLAEGGFQELNMYTEVMQDSALELIRRGVMTGGSCTSLSLSREGTEELYRNMDFYRQRIILRPQEIANSPEVARRLGIIALNTPIEFDIYGNVNSSHIMGTKMMNGIGGSGDFARNAGLTIFATESVAKGGAVSCVVPMASHVDHTEHDVDILVTEQGYADLRWLAPRERAVQIIENCAHPDYRPMLWAYFRESMRLGGHTPHELSKALSWHQRYLETGTMKHSAQT